jgi:hypothetical protein
MKKYISIILLLLFINSIKSQTQKYKLINNEEQQLINDLCSTLIDTTRLMVIYPLIDKPVNIFFGNETLNLLGLNYGFEINDFQCLASDTTFIKENPKALGNYLPKNGTFRLFKDSLLIKENKFFQVLSIDTITKYSISDILKKKKYPLGHYLICDFGKIVFSKNQKFAVVDYSIHCGNWCYDGATVLMEYKNSKWVVVKTLSIKIA